MRNVSCSFTNGSSDMKYSQWLTVLFVSMTQEEIIEKIITYLDQHFKNTRGAISQEPYKGDFFDLFREAYRNGYFDPSSRPRLTGDALSDILAGRWLTGDEGDKGKCDWMHKLLPKWDEWWYAWDQIRKEGVNLETRLG